MKFDCELCDGVCCFSPPQLEDEKEIEKAIGYGVDVKAVEVGADIFAIGIVKSGSTCPFLGRDKKCSIYDDRFNVCRNFKCASYGVEVDTTSLTLLLPGLTVPGVELRGRSLFGRDVVRKYGIDVVPIEDAVIMMAAVDEKDYIDACENVLKKIFKAREI